MAYYAGDTITDYISHIVSGVPITGATFTVTTATKPNGSSFTPTITEVGGGTYTVSFQTTSQEMGSWYLLVVDSAQDPDVFYEQTYDVDRATNASAGVSRGQLRLDIGRQIGDVLVCTATSASAFADLFVDEVNIVQGNNTLASRQAICVSVAEGARAANIGLVRLVTGNTQGTSTLNLRPNLPVAAGVGDVLELYSKHGGGPLIADIHGAINRAIRDAGENNPVEVTATAVAFDPDFPTYTIPAEWFGFIGAEWEDDTTSTWPTASWRELDRVGRTVVIGARGASWLADRNVRLRGYTVPSDLANETDETNINAEWLINRASAYLSVMAKKQTPTEANITLGFGSSFLEQAERAKGLARPRLRPFHRLGAI